MRLPILIVITFWVASCGQKGPLELPPPSASAYTLTTSVA